MFTGTFSITAQPGLNVGLYTDTSDYTDEPENTFVTRWLTLTTTTGTTLVPAGTTTAYIPWPYTAGATLVVDCMTRDYAVVAQVQWFSEDPQDGSEYIAALVVGFNSYNDQGEYGIIQAMTAVPNIVNQPDYLLSLALLQLEQDNSEQAVYYQQQDEAQSSMGRGAFLLNNKLKYF